MVDDVTFNLNGLDELVRKMGLVTSAVKGAKGRSALRKAANVVKAAARQNVEAYDDPETGRKISKNIDIRWNRRRYKSTGDLAFRIGVLKGARIPKDNHDQTGTGTATPHWRLLEFGTRYSVAKPFLRPALANNIQAVTSMFLSEFEKMLTAAIEQGQP